MVEEKLLILKFKLGDTDALRRIYEKYKNDLLKLAIALLNDVNIAEDVVEEVFTAFAQSAATIRIHGNLKSYLTICVANRIRNTKRDRQRHQACDITESEGLVCQSRRPEQWAMINEEMELLSQALVQIPYEQREVLSLYMQGDITFKQIAKIQNASINTVQGRYRYGLNKLRSLLNGEMKK
ncbi:MAG: RNA polymerase sigma factor [Sedimentisphaerales bacterium]|nr:RNA polymerase sigma factor [Sedimentisphaerales bacterium]